MVIEGYRRNMAMISVDVSRRATKVVIKHTFELMQRVFRVEELRVSTNMVVPPPPGLARYTLKPLQNTVPSPLRKNNSKLFEGLWCSKDWLIAAGVLQRHNHGNSGMGEASDLAQVVVHIKLSGCTEPCSAVMWQT